MEGSHKSEGGGRGSEQWPHLPHKLPLLSLPCLALTLPVTPVLLTTCSSIPLGIVAVGSFLSSLKGSVSSHLCPKPGCWNPGPWGRKGTGGTVWNGLGKAPGRRGAGRLCVLREGPSS